MPYKWDSLALSNFPCPLYNYIKIGRVWEFHHKLTDMRCTMSADHTITTKNRTEEIAETTQKLLHDYFERSGSASLINRLAPDVLWFSEEESGGKEEAARYLTAWKEGFFNSYVESESYEAKNLGEGCSLCIANLALLVHPGKTFTLHQTRKLTFIFRRLRDKNTDESTWEIIHLAVATLAPKTAPGKLPEISCSLDNLRYLNRFTTGDLSLDETRSLYALLQEKVFRHFTQEKKDMLTALSLFDVFTLSQLLTEVEKLAELQSTLERIGRHEYGSAWSHLFHAEYYLLTGDWEKGLGELSALEASPGYANPSVKIRSAYLRGWLAFVTGRASSIREIETEMHGYLASTAEYQTLIASLSECGFHLMFGTDSNIKKEYKRILDPQRFYFPSHTYIEIMKDRILLRDGKDTDLLAEAETHETHARQRKSVIGMIFALLNQAAAYKRLGEEENSLQALEEALTLAGPDHLILPFILFSDELKDLWKKVRAPRHSASIVETMSQYTRPTSPEIPSLEEMRRDQIKKLTGREMEIIHLAVQGLKNKEIAEEQKVAEITIKKAMSTIYRKLNISGRPELLTIFGEEKHEEE